MTHYAPLVAALVSMLLTLFLLLSKTGKAVHDISKDTPMIDGPLPRIGGVGLLAGILSGWALMLKLLVWWVVLPVVLLFAVSLVAEIKGLSMNKQIGAHIVAALVLAFGSGMLVHYPALAIALLLATVWMTNLFNLMDGSDGLAGGMAFFGFTMYGVASLMHGDDSLAMINFSVSAASLGFLFHNFHPAKVVMGNAGSIPLGFLAAAMGLWGWQLDAWPAWFPALVFSPFIVDATVTVIKRSLSGVKVIEVHCEHYYQRMIRMGWGRRNVALVEYGLMFAAGASAIWAERQSSAVPWGLVLSWGSVFAVAMLALDVRWKAFNRGAQ